jgi:hypothetical protein
MSLFQGLKESYSEKFAMYLVSAFSVFKIQIK